ncbi:hypothetical protein PSAB6_50210 [Paraburkholderia sabiae]|nr:hypothetical protein PSAB6_50210 [Paraburkholderia sabiae]
MFDATLSSRPHAAWRTKRSGCPKYDASAARRSLHEDRAHWQTFLAVPSRRCYLSTLLSPMPERTGAERHCAARALMSAMHVYARERIARTDVLERHRRGLRCFALAALITDSQP